MYDENNTSDTGKKMPEIRRLHDRLVEICAMSLKEVKTVVLKDKSILIRTIMRDMHDYGLYTRPTCDLSAEGDAVDMWVDKAEYIDDKAFYLYLTQAEPNIFWNMEREGEVPERIEDAKMRIAIRCNSGGEAPFVPVAYLLALTLKLASQPVTDWMEYLNEHPIRG